MYGMARAMILSRKREEFLEERGHVRWPLLFARAEGAMAEADLWAVEEMMTKADSEAADPRTRVSGVREEGGQAGLC